MDILLDVASIFDDISLEDLAESTNGRLVLVVLGVHTKTGSHSSSVGSPLHIRLAVRYSHRGVDDVVLSFRGVVEDPDVAAAARADPFDARLVADEKADVLGALSEDVRDAEVPDPAMRILTEERPGKVVVLVEALALRLRQQCRRDRRVVLVGGKPPL